VLGNEVSIDANIPNHRIKFVGEHAYTNRAHLKRRSFIEEPSYRPPPSGPPKAQTAAHPDAKAIAKPRPTERPTAQLTIRQVQFGKLRKRENVVRVKNPHNRHADKPIRAWRK
jgi:hypothetical protein